MSDDEGSDVDVDPVGVMALGSFLFDGDLFLEFVPFAAAFKRRCRRFFRFEDMA